MSPQPGDNSAPWLDEVFHKGDTVIIARKGKALARLMPLEQRKSHDTDLSLRQSELLKKLHSLPALTMNKILSKFYGTCGSRKV
ncbi:MAG: type II toxin-antitoxin system Phd/YefM family antitoxin, partial [Candidatus Electrothrix sp. EH2]|nr:type II toxin-antitoxin system Phd/YefM family antitoxin [Candidatus Electrothrix sp. EH2]